MSLYITIHKCIHMYVTSVTSHSETYQKINDPRRKVSGSNDIGYGTQSCSRNTPTHIIT